MVKVNRIVAAFCDTIRSLMYRQDRSDNDTSICIVVHDESNAVSLLEIKPPAKFRWKRNLTLSGNHGLEDWHM